MKDDVTLKPWERPQTKNVNLKMDAESVDEIGKLARKMGLNKSHLIKRLIWDFLSRHADEEETFDKPYTFD